MTPLMLALTTVVVLRPEVCGKAKTKGCLGVIGIFSSVYILSSEGPVIFH